MFIKISFRVLLAGACAVSLCEILVLLWRKVSTSPCANTWCPLKRKVVLGGYTVAEVGWVPLWPCEGKLVNGYTYLSISSLSGGSCVQVVVCDRLMAIGDVLEIFKGRLGSIRGVFCPTLKNSMINK